MKTIIAPVISAIFVLLQLVFGIEVPKEVIGDFTLAVVNLVAVGSVLYGIIKNHFLDASKRK